jgi:hypothetical protein
MQFAPLSSVKQRVLVGVPLPFGVRDADRTLLLAKGQVIASAAQMEALLTRGALVDLEEVLQSQAAPQAAVIAPEQLPARWQSCMDDVARALKTHPTKRLAAALNRAAEPAQALIAQDPDLAIFQVLQQHGNAHAQYGARHAVHAAITAQLMAQRLGWPKVAVDLAFKSALTMNLSMFELQGQLAEQHAPVNPKQREAIDSHARRSVEMLQLAGISDADWLEGVMHHHDHRGQASATGGTDKASDLALLLRRADVYTAKLSGRVRRDPIDADQAGRQMFSQDPGHPMNAALAREFGVYPPGCHVALASGEVAIVIKRGPTVTTPIVAAVTSERGAGLSEPHRRDTSKREHAVVAVVSHRRVQHRVAPEKLMMLAAA